MGRRFTGSLLMQRKFHHPTLLHVYTQPEIAWGYAETRVRLCPCKIDLSPQVISYYWSFQGDTSVLVLIVLCLSVEFCAVSTLCAFSYF